MSDDMLLFFNQFDQETQKRVKQVYQWIKECGPAGMQEEVKGRVLKLKKRNCTITLQVYPDHMNLQAKGIQVWKTQIDYTMLTPRGKLKLYHGKELPYPLLKLIVQESFR